MNLMQGQKVLLVGLGESGLACARWAILHGADLTIIDSRSEPPGLSKLIAEGVAFECVSDAGALQWPYDRVCVSPGLPPDHPLMKDVVSKAVQLSIAVESELDWFADALVALKAERDYEPKVISVTGTNGKTTTVKMIACLVKHANQTVKYAGNISPAALEALRLSLDADDLPEVWVLELSSFQLHWTSRLRSNAATVLNLSEDHLDWHACLDEYACDKARIFSEGCVCILNRDDPKVMALLRPEATGVQTFGLGKPSDAGQFGLVRDGGIVWLAMTDLPVEATPRSRKKLESEDVQPKLLMPVDALKIVGMHNASNALAALALCRAVGLPMAGLLHGLRVYEGEPHRVQFVRSVNEVDYFDDSKGTNVGATVAALNGLARRTILIAGGLGKGQDFAPLVEPVRQYCKSAILFGQDAQLIQHAIGNVVTTHLVGGMEQAVQTAAGLAGAGDCVLLSPACSSLDMFENYVERARAFVEAVEDLAMQGGQVC